MTVSRHCNKEVTLVHFVINVMAESLCIHFLNMLETGLETWTKMKHQDIFDQRSIRHYSDIVGLDCLWFDAMGCLRTISTVDVLPKCIKTNIRPANETKRNLVCSERIYDISQI